MLTLTCQHFIQIFIPLLNKNDHTDNINKTIDTSADILTVAIISLVRTCLLIISVALNITTAPIK